MSAATRNGTGADAGGRAMLRQELHLLRREGLAPWALVALTLLLVAAAVNGRALLGVQARTAAVLEEETRQTTQALADQARRGVATAISPGAVGYSVLSEPAVLPPAPLGALAIGQGDLLPAYYAVTARGPHDFLARSEPENPLRLSIGNFDAAFVIVWLLPLVVIALSFNVVSAERERGVLAIAVATGASPADFILGKVAARALLVFGSLWIALLAAALAGGVPLTRAAGALPLLLWLGGATLYGAFWFALALFVNSRPRASDQNASLLAGAWLLLVILLPALTNLAATTVFAAPSRVELTTELREASEAADRAAAATRDQYFFDHPEMQGGDMDRTAYFQSVAQSEQSIAQAMAPLLAQFDTQARRQQGLVEVLQFLSPGTLTYETLTALAGSDGARHREFRAQALAFHDRWSGFFRSRLMRAATLTPADYAALPQFRFDEPPLGRALSRAAPALAVLLALALLLGGIAVQRLRRFPVV
jgi:ABC-2 type transport system permease protein